MLLDKQVCSHHYIIDYIVCLSAPSGPPLSINVTSSQPNVIILSWSPPDMSLQNGIIISYTYNCTEFGESKEVDRGTVTSTTAVIINTMIKAYTDYICFVSATTSVGSGPNGNATGRTAEDSMCKKYCYNYYYINIKLYSS